MKIKQINKTEYVTKKLKEIELPKNYEDTSEYYFNVCRVRDDYLKRQELSLWERIINSVPVIDKYEPVISNGETIIGKDFILTIHRPLPKELFNNIISVVEEHYDEYTVEIEYPATLDEVLLE